ncbi:MAG TPA: pyridoxamine 5'-phosphate oxidase family protein [Acidimicrobiales bacterium]
MSGVRTTEQRKADALAKLAESDADLWVATASATGEPYLVPLSYAWDGVDVILSTHSSTLTARNLEESGRARLGVGHTRDVVMIDAHVVDTVSISDAPSELVELYATQTDWDPRGIEGYVYLRLRPERVQAWREANETVGRDVMRSGTWLA